MGKKIIVIFLIFFQANLVLGSEKPIKAIKNRETVELINFFRDFFETPIDYASNDEFRIRILNRYYPSDCSVNKCKTKSMYIAITTLDEFPIANLFVLPKAYNWKFSKIVKMPKSGETEPAIIEISEKIKNKESEWVWKKYHVYIRPEKAVLKEID